MKPDTDIYFTVSTCIVDDNRELGKGVRDKDGYFTDVPVAVLGTTTRNKTSYDTKSVIDNIKGPDSTFHIRLTEGTLYGEHGHPFVDLNTRMGMQRLMSLEASKESHHIRSVKVKRVDDLGIDLVLIDTKGSGPYGKYHDEAMLDPSRNIAYSLRGLSKGKLDKRTGVMNKELVSLVTFDSNVPSGGFKEASKRYMSSTENLSYYSEDVVDQIIIPDDYGIIREVALETFTDTELNDILKKIGRAHV